jgi:DNA polymerase-3 subunit beta
LVERAAGDVPNLPILKNVLIKTDDGKITLTTTNLEIGVVAVVAGKIIESGDVTVPISFLSSLLTNLQSDRLNLESKNNSLEIKTDNYTAKIQGFSSHEFPKIPQIQNKNKWLEIKGLILKEALQQVLAASQISDLRPELNGVFLDFSIEHIAMAATDGFRLAEKEIPKNQINVKDEEPFKILIPIRTAHEAVRNIKNEDDVKIFHDENQILLSTERFEIISRTINAQFPEYSHLVPNKFLTEITVDKEEFAGAVRVTSVFGQKNNEIALIINPNKKNISIHSIDHALGENDYIVPARAKGEAMDIVFNWRFLADALKAIPTKEIFLGFQEETNPALIKPVGDPSYFYILKPLVKN